LVKINNYDVVEGIYYSEDHMWVRIEDGMARVGLTDFAQKQLRDIVFVELPSVGDVFKKNEVMGTVESVKAVSDLLAPLSGTVDQINEEVESSPEFFNEDPYGEGWFAILSPTNLQEELKELMDFDKTVEWYKELAKET
jgi:glycine cleavage system H protein